MTDQARARKIEKSLAMYLDPASSPEQKTAAAEAIARLQSGLTPEFWATRETKPPKAVRTRVQKDPAPDREVSYPASPPLGMTLGDLINLGVDAGMKRVMKTIHRGLA